MMSKDNPNASSTVECITKQLDADILQAASHQFLHMYHFELLQYTAQAHVGIVAAGYDKYQQGGSKADIQ